MQILKAKWELADICSHRNMASKQPCPSGHILETGVHIMKSRILLAASAAALLAPAAGMAAGSHTLIVSATVDGVCTFDLPDSPLAFGNIDPAGTVPATASATVDFHCSNGQAYSVTLAGTGAYTLTGPSTINYNAAISAGAAGTGSGMTGAPSQVTVDATIAVADYQNANAGVYSGTLTLNVAP